MYVRVDGTARQAGPVEDAAGWPDPPPDTAPDEVWTAREVWEFVTDGASPAEIAREYRQSGDPDMTAARVRTLVKNEEARQARARAAAA